jgi:DNA-binding phage protein
MTAFKTTAEQKLQLYRIAGEMERAGLHPAFITDAVKIAEESEGVFDLMVLWQEETAERDEILADLQEIIDEQHEQPAQIEVKPKIPFEKLDAVAEEVIAFKNQLRKKVDAWGGVTKLAEQTGMPQPSLSRFFRSASMPRRVTLYKIAAALGLGEDEIAFRWTA